MTELLLADRSAIDANPLSYLVHVRGGKQASAVAMVTQNALCEGTGGAFTFCPSNMDH